MDIRRYAGLALVLAFCLLPEVARATNCSGLPTSFTGGEFPNGDFFTNFNNSCYTIHLGTGYGSTEYGDLNAKYYQLYYKVDPRYQLILVGTFPNTRYFSVSLNDAHSALSASLLDTDMVPLTSQYINPYLPGVTFVDGQQYAVPISFGGTPGTLENGCKMNGYNVSPNALDASVRHQGMDWNNDAGFWAQNPGFSPHDVDTPQHTNPNTAGVLMLRAYVDITPDNYATDPHVIVRDTATGCAYPAEYAINTLGIVAASSNTGSAWMDHQQNQAHKTYETSFLPKLCDAPIASPDKLRWTRQPEYVPATNPNASYLTAPLPRGITSTLASSGEVMRIRVRVPTTPPTPCTDGCVSTGNEQMRYMSLSFVLPGGSSLASLDDAYFTKDANGYATLIVGTGAKIPDYINPAHGYTYLDLTSIPSYQQLDLLTVRHMIPGPGFTCAGQYLPYRTAVDGPNGSFVGDYFPVVDYPAASSLPQTPTPLVGESSCDTFPVGVSGSRPSCSVLPAPNTAVSSVVTQCTTPGCGTFVAQLNPPIIVTGAGFGIFPDGTPFSGTSQYLRLTDTTQHWSAGYTGDVCTVSISSWTDTLIQFVAKVNHQTLCPIAAGDTMHLQVWNPQTMAEATYKLTASAN